MLKIRLQRVGRVHEPTFRLVLTDSKNSTKSGKYLEMLGSYDARKGGESTLNSERVSYWMSKGAKVTDTVHNMLVDKKVISSKKINKLPLKKAIIKEVIAEAKTENTTSKEEVTPESSPVVEESAPVVETEVPAEVA